jgi:ribose 1,5-bisphosphate isomerase
VRKESSAALISKKALTGPLQADRIMNMAIESEILDLIEEIRSDHFRGASELGRLSLTTLKLSAERSQARTIDQFWQDEKTIGEYLMSARPSMAPVFNMVNQFLIALSLHKGKDLVTFKNLAIEKSDEIIKKSMQAVEQISRFSSQIVADGDVIMTHSYSSTVTAALKMINLRCPRISVIITRSGVGRTGENMAQQVSSAGIPVTFIDDAAMGVYVLRSKKIIVGADRICADGFIINGVGTYLLALAARRAEVPFYVLCETLKFDPRLKGDEVQLEEKLPHEVVHPGVLPPQVKVRNPYFDVTPSDLITGVVSELGLMTPAEIVGYVGTLVT